MDVAAATGANEAGRGSSYGGRVEGTAEQREEAEEAAELAPQMRDYRPLTQRPCTRPGSWPDRRPHQCRQRPLDQADATAATATTRVERSLNEDEYTDGGYSDFEDYEEKMFEYENRQLDYEAAHGIRREADR